MGHNICNSAKTKIPSGLSKENGELQNHNSIIDVFNRKIKAEIKVPQFIHPFRDDITTELNRKDRP
jgi:hypothetical protein